MYRICKVLNHNGVIALDMNDSKEYVLLGKGVGLEKSLGSVLNSLQTVRCILYRRPLQEETRRN